MSQINQTRGDVASGQMAKGSAWMIAQRWGIRLTGLVSTVVLARLLQPSDFGIVAMAMVFVGLLEILNQTGQKLAIIRHTDPTAAHFDTAWTISVIGGIVIGAMIVLLAPLTTFYFHEPRAIPVMQCLALRAVLGGLENIGVVVFRRDLRFDRFFRYNIYPKLISFFVTVGLAILWKSYWALVVGILTSQLAAIILSYVMHPYRPHFSIAKIGEIWAFSSWSFLKTLGGYLNSQIDQVAVGGAVGTGAMGSYAVAADLASSPILEINDPMVAVLYPVMSAMRGDVARMRDLYLKTLGWSVVICISAGVGIALVAHDMVRVVLGPNWSFSEPLIRWLALGTGLLGLSSGAYTTFDVLGKPHLSARMQWVRLLLLFAAVIPVAFLFKDAQGVAAVRMAVTALFIPSLLLAVGREMDISARDYLIVFWRPCTAGLAMCLVIYPLNTVFTPGGSRLMLDVAMGAVTFMATLLLLWKIDGQPASPERDVMLSFARISRTLWRGRV
jgi:lipopolysaccharide exporter